MDNLIYIIFACMALPLLLSLALVDKKSKLVIGFIIIGAFMCVFVSELNSIAKALSGESIYYVTTNLTPITEEIVKALPILMFGFLFSDKKETLISLSVAVGIGFAIVENIYIFVQAGSSYTLLWAIRRVFGASLMHTLCTSAVGYGISFVKKKKKLFYTGTFALLIVAMVYHSIFNSLIQSEMVNLGLLLPVVTYIPIVLYQTNVISKSKLIKKEA